MRAEQVLPRSLVSSSVAMCSLLLGSLLLLLPGAAAAADTPQMHSVMMAPALLKANTSERICVQLTNIPAPTPLIVTLGHSDFNIIALNQTVPAGSAFFTCVHVQVPSLPKADIAYISVEAGVCQQRRSVVINGVPNICVVQTDKPIYKAGQKVHARLICMNSTFHPVKEQVVLMELMDPSRNRLMQQRNVESTHAFPTFTYQLLDEPQLGYYQLSFQTASGDTVSHSFEVREYVIPKFQATLIIPQTINVYDQKMDISVSGRYTYNQALPAKVSVSICRKPNYWNPEQTCKLSKDGLCVELKGELGPDGVLNMTVDLLKFQMYRPGLQMSLTVEATMTEQGTDVQVVETAYVHVAQEMARLNYDYSAMEQYYKRGLDYVGAVTLKGSNNEPIPNEEIEFYIEGLKVANGTTDQEGKCHFSINTTDFLKPTVVLQARYQKNAECYPTSWSRPNYPTTDYYISRFYSKTGSFLKATVSSGTVGCGQTTTVTGQFILNHQALAKDATSVVFYYVGMSKAEITVNGQVEAPLGAEAKGSFSFSVRATHEVAPKLNMMVFAVLPNGEIVGDKVEINVEQCFQNQVNLTVSAQKALPGANITVNLQAAPNSQCGLRAIDQSINLLSGQGSQTLAQEVFNRMPSRELWGYHQEGFNLQEPEPPCQNLKNIFQEGVPYMALDVSGDGSVHGLFQNMGMQLGTCVDQRKPNVCPIQNFCPEPSPAPFTDGRPRGVGGGFGGGFGGSGFEGAPVAMKLTSVSGAADMVGNAVQESVRVHFPETWFFDDATVNAEGKAALPYKVPDTITEWKLDSFCLSEDAGFGATQVPASLICFQEMFLEMALPYSIFRGETFVLKASIHTYLPQCVRLKAVLSESPDYTAKSLNTELKSCVCQNQQTTYSWTFAAKTLSNINITMSAETVEDSTCNKEPYTGPRYKDIVTRTLLVKPEGIPREETQSNLICPKGSPVSQSLDLKLPANMVNGSARGFVTCLGDAMGVSVRNLDNLVQMPSGCGEQNMAKFCSNIVAYNYLNATHSLTPEMESKIRNNLNVGYARQLTFYDSSGCFTTWARNSWNQNPPCSLWLTAMALGCIQEARKIIFVDGKIPNQIESWISTKQNNTGAFQDDGHSFNSRIQDAPSYSAYIAINFAKAGVSNLHPVQSKVLEYLDSVVETTAKTHAQAMVCLAFASSGNVEKQKLLLGKLAAKAVNEGNGLYLKGEEEQTDKGFSYSLRRKAPSSTILTNAYHLLCHLQREELSAEDLTKAADMGHWLGSQMNGNGGFYSSLDTKVGLEAMAKFQQLVSTKNGTSVLTLKSGGKAIQQFSVNRDNTLLLQRADLKTLPGVYTAEVTGTACVYIQSTLRYNIQLANIQTSFDLVASTSPETCLAGAQTQFVLHVNVSYTGSEDASNMAIIDVTFPSGHRAVDSSLRELMEKRFVDRFETSTPGHAYFYFDKITHNKTSFSFSVEQLTPVDNLQPVEMRVYDYYNPDRYGIAQYAAPCSQSSPSGSAGGDRPLAPTPATQRPVQHEGRTKAGVKKEKKH
ncbi:alpha-2-macroglobulin-like isoform X2 [Ambystoma mexicanum]|uniref:alpha-2-macroglobulin-like isoform X2 n=1 Tax=Ambystoma mexicanum TaxID=8296 RepID=UPI0037E98FAE